MRLKKDCKYPDCQTCEHKDCIMEKNDIAALLKRRRWKNNPELMREKQNAYRKRQKSYFPHCTECSECILVHNATRDGMTRICLHDLRIIERKVSNSPRWCFKRKERREKHGREKERG